MRAPLSVPHCVLGCLALAAAPAAQEPSPLERTTLWPGGGLKERYTVDEQGNKHGHFERWTPTGVRTLFEVYVQGKLHGMHREWTDTGVLICSMSFQDDMLNGVFETYHENGRTAISGSYRDNKKTGKWTETDASGDRRRTSEYREGQLHGTVRIQWKGRQLTHQTWKRGELTALGEIVPFPVPRDTLLTQLREILATEKTADPSDAESEQRQDALMRLRAYRHLCGLPQSEMQLWQPWNTLCDAAAEACRRNGKLDHHPEKPPGMDDKRFQQAVEGASHSNLAVGGSLVDSVDNYMDDSDPSNIDRLGHRRWCLNPAMKKTAFGTDENYHAMWSMDASGGAAKDLDTIYYPPRGYVPVDFFSAERAFSISPLKGGAVKASELRASIRPLDDEYLPGESLDIADLHVADAGYGTGICIVFRGKGLKVAAGSRYLVEVSTDGGLTQEHRYVVEFCEPAGNVAK
ncbi:MAG TPA: hypothetical protein VF384_10335 [Planctomycetota bacterium]